MLIVIVWTDENEGFRTRCRHTSYSACPVRDAIVFPSSASVFEWRGENDLNRLRVGRGVFFSKWRKIVVFKNILIRVDETIVFVSWPFPSSQNSLFQNEAKCKIFLVKMSFYFHEN